MQGIYNGFNIYYHDSAWSAVLDLVQDHAGMSMAEDAYRLIELSGSAGIQKE